MNKQNTWGIIGTGWLGSEISARLDESGIDYWGTNRKTFEWGVHEFPENFCDVLLLNTPPLVSLAPEDFVAKVPTKESQKIIFISSIGVYGSALGTLTESTEPRPNTQNGVWLYEVEKLLLSRFKDQITVLRAGGLIGGTRHPVISLSKNTQAVVGDSPINLIHRRDLIEIIFSVASLNKAPPLINAVAPFHPNKSEYYSAWTKKLNLRPIRFSSNKESGKVVASEILPTLYPNWLCPQLDAL